jgi:DNA topoisomerase-1
MVEPSVASMSNDFRPSATASHAVAELAAARQAGLRYLTDQRPGIKRIPSGKGFRYSDANNRAVTDSSILIRIKSLVVPPAWREVWIAPEPNAHLQAIGWDARGRKQYRYHPQWRATRDATKFDKMMAFGRALPRIRRRVSKDLRTSGLGREKVLATIVRLLDLCAIRVGNDEYAEQNDSYGLTTLQDRHVKINGSTIQFRFRGKSGKCHALSIANPNLARIVKKCQELPGQELFQWVDGAGKVHDVRSSDVNEYLFQIAGENFTSKDFRTWTGTVFAAEALCTLEFPSSNTGIQASIREAIACVAQRLGNTVAVCRKCYVHPAVLESFCDGALGRIARGQTRRRNPGATRGLSVREGVVLTLLRQKRGQGPDAELRSKLLLSLKKVKGLSSRKQGKPR